MFRRRPTYLQELQRRRGVPSFSRFFKYLGNGARVAFDLAAVLGVVLVALALWLIAFPVLVWDLVSGGLSARSGASPQQETGRRLP